MCTQKKRRALKKPRGKNGPWVNKKEKWKNKSPLLFYFFSTEMLFRSPSLTGNREAKDYFSILSCAIKKSDYQQAFEIT